MHGVFLDIDSLAPGDLDTRGLLDLPVEWTLHPRTEPGECKARMAGADIAVCNKVRIDAATMAAAPGLKLICVTATGTNNIDLAAARERGIAVCNAPGYATPSVVEHVFALLLTLVRRLDAYRLSVSRGDWSRSTQFCVFDEPIDELAGKTLGIVGYGELGRAVAGIAEAFGMRVLLCQRPGTGPTPGRWPLERLLPVVDVLSLHCPLTDSTRHLIGAAEFALMKSGALLINTARGGIVDESALLDALRSGRLAGAALDVLAEEPPPTDHALIRAALPNLIVTPHVAWASRPARQRLLDVTTANIRAFLQQTPVNRVE
jgi:glycerate dehydrogenase